MGQDRARQLLERDSFAQTTSPLLGGVFVSGTYPDVVGEVTLLHRLGRVPQGWFCVDCQGPFLLFRVPQPAETERNSLRLARVAGESLGGVDAPFTIYVF